MAMQIDHALTPVAPLQRIHPAQRPTLPTTSVVVPTLNEAANLPFVLPRIPAWVHEVVLIDGFSSDATVEVAREVLPNARILRTTQPGKGAALRTGFAAAAGDVIVMLDADGSSDPRELPMFVGA